MMSHKDIDISGLVMFVGPDDGMVSHLNGGVGEIRRFIDVGEYVHVGPGALVVGIPFF